MTDHWDGHSENQKLCEKNEDRDKIKSECLVSGDRKKYGSGNGGTSSRGDTVHQTNRYCWLSEELAPCCLKMLDCFEVWSVYDLWELRKKVRNFWSESLQAVLEEHKLCPPLLSRSREGQGKLEKRKKLYILKFLKIISFYSPGRKPVHLAKCSWCTDWRSQVRNQYVKVFTSFRFLQMNLKKLRKF